MDLEYIPSTLPRTHGWGGVSGAMERVEGTLEGVAEEEVKRGT